MIQNRIFTITPILMAFGISAIASTLSAAPQERESRDRSFDAMRYVTRADRDEDGILDEKELGGRLKDWVSKLGVDTSRPVPITKIEKAIEAKAKRESEEERLRNIDANRQVPKFGTDTELPPPPDFSVSEDAESKGRLEDNYDRETVDSVRGYMRREDKNKDGVLTKDETERARRWLGDSVDADKNGSITEKELAEGIKQRNSRDDRRRGDSGRSDRDRRTSSRESSDRSSRSSSSSNSRDFRGRSTARESRAPTSSSSSTPKRSSRSMTGRYTAFVDGVLKKYDSDGDGKLNSDERKKVSKSTPLVDENGDGMIDRKEILNSIEGRAKAAPSSSASSTSQSSRRRSSRSSGREDEKDEDEGRSRSSRSRSSSRSSGKATESSIKYDIRGFEKIRMDIPPQTDRESFLKREGASRDFLEWDKNTDGHISMGEIRRGKKWTNELAKKFQKLDSNNDRVITIEEFEENFNSRDFDD